MNHTGNLCLSKHRRDQWLRMKAPAVLENSLAEIGMRQVTGQQQKRLVAKCVDPSICSQIEDLLRLSSLRLGSPKTATTKEYVGTGRISIASSSRLEYRCQGEQRMMILFSMCSSRTCGSRLLQPVNCSGEQTAIGRPNLRRFGTGKGQQGE